MKYNSPLVFLATTNTDTTVNEAEENKENKESKTNSANLDFKLSASDINIPGNKLSYESIGGLVRTALFWGASLAVIMMIVGGIFYASSASDETKVRRAKATILFSAIGFAVMLLAFVIVNFVITSVEGNGN